jgi:hypothetical protein
LTWGGAVWAAGAQSAMSLWDLETGLVETFLLPKYWVPGEECHVHTQSNCEGSTMQTTVGGIAVAPNGDVYFSDFTWIASA